MNQKVQDDKQFDKQMEDYYRDLEEELGSFSVDKLFENNGRSIVNNFFDKLFRMRKQRANYLKRATDFYVESGQGSIKEKRLQGFRFVYEYLDLSKRYFNTFLIHAIHVLKDEGEEAIKGVLTHYFEVYKTVLDDYLEEDRRFVTEEAGKYIVTDRTIPLYHLQEQLKQFDIEAQYQGLKDYKPSKEEAEHNSIGSNALYISLAIALGCMGESYSHGQAFFIRYDPLKEIPSLILEIKEILLDINKLVPFMGDDIPGELEFELIRCYLSPDVCLLEQVKRANEEYLNEQDNYSVLEDDEFEKAEE